MLSVKEVVEVCDDHESEEVHDDVKDRLRSHRDHDVVQDGHEDDNGGLAETASESHRGVLETPEVVHNKFHLRDALLELSRHGDVHHDAGYEPGECQFHSLEYQRVKLVLACLVQDQKTDGDLEDPNDQGLRENVGEALVKDLSSLQDVFGELLHCLGL